MRLRNRLYAKTVVYGLRRLVTIFNSDSLSSNETGVSSGIRYLKIASSQWVRRQKAFGSIYFTEEMNSWDSTILFRIWQSQTPSWKRYLQPRPLAEWFFFWGKVIGFSERGSQGSRLIYWLQCRLVTCQLFSVFKSIVYGLSSRLSNVCWFEMRCSRKGERREKSRFLND